MKLSDFRITPGRKVHLADHDPDSHGGFHDKEAAKEKLQKDIKRMAKLQDAFYAADSHSLLIIFQAMDAAGKDGAIKHVMTGLNPQGCQVAAFKSPSSKELEHDYLWRCNLALPERGHIGIFNRSYYEEVLAVRVHPEFLAAQRIPGKVREGKIWRRRFQEINNFEKHLSNNGTRILKFFLHVSKDEQKKRFLERIENPDKNWKLSPNDVRERGHWDAYRHAYEDMLSHTSTGWAPWHVVPANKKWFTRVVIADIVVKTMESLNSAYPVLTDIQRAQLEEAKALLLAEE